MLKKFFWRFARKDEIYWRAKLEKSKDLWIKEGDPHAAIVAFREYLKDRPADVEAINCLGACLEDTGNKNEAYVAYDLAYSLDDTFIPAVVNYAKGHMEQKKSADALSILKKAWVCEPTFPSIYAVYGNICFGRADADKARISQLRAWLGSFDSARLADAYLFESSYADDSELSLAAEHRFWAETLRPIDYDFKSRLPALSQNEKKTVEDSDSPKRIKIGYWSPDLRNHSVRYFFRPLLESHDHSRFDVHVFNDSPHTDEQTELIKEKSPHFHEVNQLKDAKLAQLIESHELDILVELAGHTSYNRLSLFQHRLAAVHISALGYPPTTGLASIDFKLMDVYTMGSQPAHYYAEAPLALPSSFWCFDPLEDAPMENMPPVERNGYITFACVGNIAKINDRILRCWKSVLDGVPNSKLLIRSLSFDDEMASRFIRKKLKDLGFDDARIDLRKPAGGVDFFSSYNEIDIVFDTFPFNGGTTTCFAVYQGVPVVTMAGDSLISRMGFSVLSNIGYSELVTYSENEYIECAIRLATDLDRLRRFRAEARERFKASSLGDSKKFTKDFEIACVQLIENGRRGQDSRVNSIPILPANELTRRAYIVASYGQKEAAERVIQHCLTYYPENGVAHIFLAQELMAEKGVDEACLYLAQRIERFSEEDKIPALINLIRWSLLGGAEDDAHKWIRQLMTLRPGDAFDRMQADFFAASLDKIESPLVSKEAKNQAQMSIKVLVCCDDMAAFEETKKNIQKLCFVADKWSIVIERCDEMDRIKEYENLIEEKNDILIFLQKTIAICNPLFFVELVEGIRQFDLIGVAGASRWNRLNWRTDDFEHKSGGFLSLSTTQQGAIEVQLLGARKGYLVENQAILDGSVLAMNPAKMRGLAFDDELLGAEWLMEEAWTHDAYKAGLRLGVHRNLGVLFHSHPDVDIRAFAPGRLRVLEKMDFNPFDQSADDNMTVSVTVRSVDDAISIVEKFLREI